MVPTPLHAIIVAVPRSRWFDEGRTRGTNDVPYGERRARAVRVAAQQVATALDGLLGPEGDAVTLEALLDALSEATEAARADDGRVLLLWSGRAWQDGDTTWLALPDGTVSTSELAAALDSRGIPALTLAFDTFGRVGHLGADVSVPFALRPADTVANLLADSPSDDLLAELRGHVLNALREEPSGQVGAEENDYAPWTHEDGGGTVDSALFLLVSGDPITGVLLGLMRLEHSGREEWWMQAGARLPERYQIVSFAAAAARWDPAARAARFHHETWAQEGFVVVERVDWKGFGATATRHESDELFGPPRWMEVAGQHVSSAPPEVRFYLKVERDGQGRILPGFGRDRWWSPTPDAPNFIVSGPSRLLFRTVAFEAERLLYPAR